MRLTALRAPCSDLTITAAPFPPSSSTSRIQLGQIQRQPKQRAETIRGQARATCTCMCVPREGGGGTPRRYVPPQPSLALVVGASPSEHHQPLNYLLSNPQNPDTRRPELNAVRNDRLGRPADHRLVGRAALPADVLVGHGRGVCADVLAVCGPLGRVGAGEHLLPACRGGHVGGHRGAVLFLAGGVSAGVGDRVLVYGARGDSGVGDGFGLLSEVWSSDLMTCGAPRWELPG